MREHLYHGKRVDNGEWVEGGITFDTTGTPYICPTRFSDYDEEIEVLPQTVGEYTGLTDKNGKKIFEGHIVKSADGVEVVSLVDGCFYPMGAYCARSGFDYDSEEWEVIGNIHDNPDLLEDHS